MSFSQLQSSKWAGLVRWIFIIATSTIFSCLHAIGQSSPSLPVSPELKDASDEAIISNREEVQLVEDSNVAEAVARRPDLQYNNVIVDGEQSNLSLNDIPSDAINEVELLRAVTPDMDADSRGGSLNLSSNPIFKLENPVFKATTWGQYSEGEDTWAQGASVSYSRPVGNFGIRVNASTSNSHDTLESFNMRWSPESANLYSPDYLIENREEIRQINSNFGFAIDYRISENFHAFARLNYSETAQEGYHPSIFMSFTEGADDPRYKPASASVENATILRDLTAYESQWDQLDFLLGLKFENDVWKFDTRLLGEMEGYVEPDWFVIQFQTDPLYMTYDFNAKQIPIPQTTSIDIENPGNFFFEELLSERWSNDNERWIASANLRRDFSFSGIDAYIKTGLKWTRRTKDQRSDSRIYTAYDGDFTLEDIQWNYNEDSLLFDGINWGTFPTLQDSRKFFHENREYFDYDLKRSAQKGHPATYDVEEIISSAYSMLNISHNRLRGILGFRVEQTELEYKGNAVIVDEFGNYIATEQRTGTNHYTEFFPSLHVRYFLGAKTTLIGSWTGTIERPYYGNTVPYQYINYDSQVIEQGNPKLKPTLYENFDFSIDYKLTENSLASIEFYAKEVEDVVYWEVLEVDSGQYSGFTVETHENGPNAREKGLRLILTQGLGDISDWLENFSLILKYTLQDSETKYSGRQSESLPITYRPENSFEATLTYQGEKAFIQVQYSKEDSELVSVYEEAWQDKYEIPNENLSISASYNVSDKIRAYCELSGLMESYEKTYYGVPERPSAYAWRSKKIEFGLKINL